MFDVIERVRQVIAASSRSASNASGVRPRGVYSAVAELAQRYGLSRLDLTQYELKAFSQNGEDGVIQEILRRVGATSQTFAEFGIGDGTEGNCVFLAQVMGWRGAFLEGDATAFGELARRYAHLPGVRTVHATVRPETLDDLLSEAGVPAEPDVVSIDVDGNDYYLWESLERVKPRVVVIEYNASLDPGSLLVQPYSDKGPDGTIFFGASLAALEQLGRQKGYQLVHTELAGVNAFFVRADLVGDEFLPPERVPRRPPNYYLDNVSMHLPAKSGLQYVTPPRARE